MSRSMEDSSQLSRPDTVEAIRSQRADARRNRARVLEAAEEVFATRGVMASTDEVARAAGVGIGTVFRHFPTKDALLVAVIVNRLRRFADEARALEAEDDPGRAFFTLVARAADQSAAKNAALAALADRGSELAAETRPIMGEMRRIFATLLTRAQAVGAVRSDIGVDEVTALLFGAARAAEFSGWDRDVLARMVGVISDGLRPRPPHEPTATKSQGQ